MEVLLSCIKKALLPLAKYIRRHQISYGVHISGSMDVPGDVRRVASFEHIGWYVWPPIFRECRVILIHLLLTLTYPSQAVRQARWYLNKTRILKTDLCMNSLRREVYLSGVLLLIHLLMHGLKVLQDRGD